MRNSAVLAARLAGRPVLMRPEAAEFYARRLLSLTGEGAPGRRGAFSSLLAKARRSLNLQPVAAEDDRPEAEASGPEAYWPMWLERSEGQPDDRGFGWSLKDGVALIEISGPLLDKGVTIETWDGAYHVHGYDTLLETFSEATADSRVLGIFVKFDTPGGMAAPGLPELADFIRQARAAAGGKPIWSHCDMAASAGYWLASATDRVLAPPIGMTGSIGAVLTHCDMSGALEKDGFKVTHVQFGRKKTDLSPYKALEGEALEDVQAEIDQLGRNFVAAVVAGRPNLTPDQVLETEAGCFLTEHDEPARAALARGLVDQSSSEAAAFSALRDLVAGRTTDAAPAAPAAAKETNVKRSTLAAILKDASLSADEKVRRLEVEAAADDPDDEDEDPTPTEDEDEPEAAADPAPADEDDEDEDGDPPSAETSKAILDSKLAKGREGLARELAFTPGMTVKKAERLLGKAGKRGSLADRMQGQDPNLSAQGGAANLSDFERGKAIAKRYGGARG